MKIRLYMDEDSMAEAVQRALRARDVDVITAQEVGMDHHDDVEHLDYATANGRVLCSFNTRHFTQIHVECLATGKSHAGIVVAQQQRYSIGEYVRRLSKLIAAKSAESMCDQIEFLSSWG